jgi:hydrogenase maturation protein HypF
MHTAVKVAVRGRVQGVGFRPFVFQLAAAYQLTGTVQNNMDGVKIHLAGESEAVQRFLNDLKTKAPRLSKINEIITEPAEQPGVADFSIIESERTGKSMLVIPIDSAVCDDCLREMNDPADFRYQYPFINCTQCGPRYTIIEELPYDRPYTSMKGFPMCEDCRREYEDPMNRRHHAQPIACPKCGPKVRLLSADGNEVDCGNPIKETIRLLKEGRIIAIKGLGGYHLSCDARNEQAVGDLRKRKKRPNRPLAVMTASLEAAGVFAEINEDVASLLKGPEAPIVVMNKSNRYNLAESVAPRMKTIGAMLPYTPLHHLLFSDQDINCLVMTSANPSGMPILYKEDEAIEYLSGIADYCLTNNREILHPVDDSVVQMNDGKLDFFRRARGYVPDPFITEQDVTGIIAFGGQQKTTFTIGRNEQIFIGLHIGDLENIETISHYKREMTHLLKWIDTPKRMAVIDAHPGYQVQSLAKDYDFSEVLEVQHHHAHMAACLEEHKIAGDTYGIILDGTGYGLDGKVWGFEFFYGNKADVSRLAHLHYTPLPGSEKCISEPWRNAAAMLMSLCGEKGVELSKTLFADKKADIAVLEKMIENNLNTVYAGTCGRLFDAVSAICGLTRISTYDGEAAIQLAELANENGIYEAYPFNIDEQDIVTINFSRMLENIAMDVLAGQNISVISGKFHETVVQTIVAVMEKLQLKYPQNDTKVVLSGGSLHNRYLRKRLNAELTARDFQVYIPEMVPCNDGGLSYGQLAVAEAKRSEMECVWAYRQK